MSSENLVAEQTWRLLWQQAAYQVITMLPPSLIYEPVAAGYGWGLRHVEDPQRAILLHPSANDREIGDLSLTIRGHGVRVLPRCGQSYMDYLNYITDVVNTVTEAYLTNDICTEAMAWRSQQLVVQATQ